MTSAKNRYCSPLCASDAHARLNVKRPTAPLKTTQERDLARHRMDVHGETYTLVNSFLDKAYPSLHITFYIHPRSPLPIKTRRFPIPQRHLGSCTAWHSGQGHCKGGVILSPAHTDATSTVSPIQGASSVICGSSRARINQFMTSQAGKFQNPSILHCLCSAPFGQLSFMALVAPVNKCTDNIAPSQYLSGTTGCKFVCICVG